MKNISNGWFNGVLPALFLSISAGQVYAFTNFSNNISASIGANISLVQFAFSLSILFLGLGAAFFGRIVEKNIIKSSFIGGVLFLAGMLMTALGIHTKLLSLVYIGYGFLVGTGTGILYIVPVKNLMLWFPNRKALASAVPIGLFGLGTVFSTLLYTWFIPFGITNLFLIYSLVYGMFIIIGSLLIEKPVNVEKIIDENEKSNFSYKKLLKNRFFIHSWTFMFLNIFAGLCIIPLAKQIMIIPEADYSIAVISIIIMGCGFLNGFGRFFFAWLSDLMKDRINIIPLIVLISLVSVTLSVNIKMVAISLLVINACYGAGFAVIPGILSERFGMKDLSKIHGAVLSAWGIAGLLANQISIFVSKNLSFGYAGINGMLFILYGISLLNVVLMMKNQFNYKLEQELKDNKN